MIDRRSMLAAGAGALALCPVLPAAAQVERRIRRIVIVVPLGEADPDGQLRVASVIEGFARFGWTEPAKAQFEVYWGVSSPGPAERAARTILARPPDIVIAVGTAGLAALQQATDRIPIVFAVVTDPVGAGYVRSLAQPGANITGFATFEPEIGSKWLEFLRAVAPGSTRIGILGDPTYRGIDPIGLQIETLARQHGLEPLRLTFGAAEEPVERVIEDLARGARSGLIVLPTALNAFARSRIIRTTRERRLPTVFPLRQFVKDGGLMGYGFDPNDLARRSAEYANRILLGEEPSTLPVQHPTRYNLMLNLNASAAMGIAFPPELLLRADEVIE